MKILDDSDAVVHGAAPGCVEPDRHAEHHVGLLDTMFTILLENGKLVRALFATRNHPSADDIDVRELLQLTSVSMAALGHLMRVTEDEWNTYAFD